uniref:Uncharacterized protein n=1 Tax=Ananas comosus var. bracteatus TaxID=296719 RepID=A0A6V7PST1_ANACO|nr:unnamed protein product [Ananas comosus var. bracteatus]
MKFNKDARREGDSGSIRLDIVRNANGSGGSLDFFGPQPEPSDPTPRRRRDGDFRAPEKKLTLFALRLAVLEKAASGLGTLAFIWATVVLLGGFATSLLPKDFWYVTIILLSEGTRIFSRSHELEWQHHATWTLASAGRYSFRAIKSSSRFLVRAVKAAFHCAASASRLEGDRRRQIAAEEEQRRTVEFQKQLVRYGTQRTWHPPEVPLLPYAGWVFISKNISHALTWLQIASALSCVTLSTMRLVQQDYGKSAQETANGKMALDLFYGLALAEALMFLVEKIYWTWKISYCGLLQQVSTECELGAAGIVSIRRFFYDAYSQCIERSIFDGIKMDLVTFAAELLDSESPDEQLIGARILQQFAKSESFAFEALRKIGTTTRAIERLIEMLNWKNPAEEEIRRCAAEVVSKLAGKRQNALRVAGIPGAMESIASLLYTGGGRAASASRTAEATAADGSSDAVATGESNYEFAVFNLLGLLILKKLAKDDDNCFKIGNTRGLLARIVDFTSAKQGLLRNEHALESQIRAVTRALQVVKMLVRATGGTGKMLRQEISEIVFTVSNIREILQCGERHTELQKLAIETLTGLAMDETQRSGSRARAAS